MARGIGAQVHSFSSAHEHFNSENVLMLENITSMKDQIFNGKRKGVCNNFAYKSFKIENLTIGMFWVEPFAFDDAELTFDQVNATKFVLWR